MQDFFPSCKISSKLKTKTIMALGVTMGRRCQLKELNFLFIDLILTNQKASSLVACLFVILVF